MSTVRVCAVQQCCTNDTDKNLLNSIVAIENAASQGAQIILLQELHRTLYFCQTEDSTKFDLAEKIPGPTTIALQKTAKQNKVIIVASLFEQRAVGLYHNTAVVIDRDGSIAGIYRKMHIPDDPGYYEKFYFAPGDLGFQPIHTSLCKLGILICWDQWYPEAARLMTLRGADLLLYPTAIGWGSQENDDKEKQRQKEAWTTIQRSHAIANGLSVIVANRTGFESATSKLTQGIQFWGGSFISGAQGELLASASKDKEEILLADIDLANHERIRRGWPFLRDRRIEEYAPLTARYLD